MKRRVLPSVVRLSRRIQAQVFGTPVPQEVDEEIAFHVEMRIREYLQDGLTLEEARSSATSSRGRPGIPSVTSSKTPRSLSRS